MGMLVHNGHSVRLLVIMIYLLRNVWISTVRSKQGGRTVFKRDVEWTSTAETQVLLV